MRTRLSVCLRKRRYPTEAAALDAARAVGDLRPYRCDRCRQFHLTSRTKGKRPLAFDVDYDPVGLPTRSLATDR